VSAIRLTSVTIESTVFYRIQWDGEPLLIDAFRRLPIRQFDMKRADNGCHRNSFSPPHF